MPTEGVPWPEPPRNLTGTPIYYDNDLVGLQIQWRRNIKPDISHHNVYKGVYEDFVPSESNHLASPIDTFFFDVHWNWMPKVYYKVNAVDSAGNESAYSLLTYTDIYTGLDEVDFPLISNLYQNYPNPFNPSTTIYFGLKTLSNVDLRIFDVSGRLVRVLASGKFQAGEYRRIWDGKDSHGIPVASGVYFYRLVAGDFEQTRKMLLLR